MKKIILIIILVGFVVLGIRIGFNNVVKGSQNTAQANGLDDNAWDQGMLFDFNGEELLSDPEVKDPELPEYEDDDQELTTPLLPKYDPARDKRGCMRPWACNYDKTANVSTSCNFAWYTPVGGPDDTVQWRTASDDPQMSETVLKPAPSCKFGKKCKAVTPVSIWSYTTDGSGIDNGKTNEKITLLGYYDKGDAQAVMGLKACTALKNLEEKNQKNSKSSAKTPVKTNSKVKTPVKAPARSQ